MRIESKGLEGIKVKEHNGSDSVNCLTPKWNYVLKNPRTPS